MPADLDHPPTVDRPLHDQLHRWVAASLITPQEADAIQSFEEHRSLPTSAPRRVPLVTEALAYVGAALAAAAAGVLLGDRWEGIAPLVRALLIGAGAGLALLGGALLRSSEEPAFSRLTSVLWFIGTGLFAWCAWIVSDEVLDQGERASLVVMGAATTSMGAVLYALRRRALQQVALFVGLLMLVGGCMPEGTPQLLAVWTVAMTWTVLAIAGKLEPKNAALAVGPVVALWAPMPMVNAETFGMWLGLGTGVAFIVVSVTLHEPVLLALGSLGVFAYTLRILIRLFGGTTAMPVALLVAGAGVLALAVLVARRTAGATRRAARRSPS